MFISRADKHFDESIHRNPDHCHIISKAEAEKERRRSEIERLLRWYNTRNLPKSIKTFRQYVRFYRLKNLRGFRNQCFNCMALFQPSKTTEQIYDEYLKMIKLHEAERSKTHYRQIWG
jgi:hypothetical protein